MTLRLARELSHVEQAEAIRSAAERGLTLDEMLRELCDGDYYCSKISRSPPRVVEVPACWCPVVSVILQHMPRWQALLYPESEGYDYSPWEGYLNEPPGDQKRDRTKQHARGLLAWLAHDFLLAADESSAAISVTKLRRVMISIDEPRELATAVMDLFLTVVQEQPDPRGRVRLVARSFESRCFNPQNRSPK